MAEPPAAALRRRRESLPAAIEGETEVCVSPSELAQRLRDAGLEERAHFEADGNAPVPEGQYFQRDGDQILVWVPPDPNKTVGRAQVLPLSIELQMLPVGQHWRLRVRNVRAPSTRWAPLWLTAITLLCLVATVPLGPAAWLPCSVGWMTAWGLFWHEHRIAAERRGHAWAAVAEVLGRLPQPQAELPAYRGYEEVEGE